MITIYGLKNCDTIKKALKWFDARGVEYHFHDFRKEGLERGLLELWVKELGTALLINKRGTTWRNLSEDQKDNLTDEMVTDLLLAHPAMIKRPVFEFDHDSGQVRRVGFSTKDQDEIAAFLRLSLGPI